MHCLYAKTEALTVEASPAKIRDFLRHLRMKSATTFETIMPPVKNPGYRKRITTGY